MPPVNQVINHNTNQAHRNFRPNYIKNKPITRNDLELVLENKECNPYKNEEKPTFNNVKSPLDCARKCVQNNLQSIDLGRKPLNIDRLCKKINEHQ